jgi:type-2 restriction enzyme eco47II
VLTRSEIENILKNQWNLPWIKQDSLEHIVKKLLKEGAPKKIRLDNRNVIDPFSALFDIAISHINFDVWEKAEIVRQHQKTLQNAIGKFHQMVLGSIDGCEDLGVGKIVDFKCEKKKIFAEIKNKFNTVKASDLKGVYKTIAEYRRMNCPDYTGYYVQILTKSRFNRCFTPSDNTSGSKPEPNPHIREIDGSSFYTLITGDEEALINLYKILPYVLQKVEPSFDADAIVKHKLYQELIEDATK